MNMQEDRQLDKQVNRCEGGWGGRLTSWIDEAANQVAKDPPNRLGRLGHWVGWSGNSLVGLVGLAGKAETLLWAR